MTPKEKAEELVRKMLSKSPNVQDGVSSIDIIQAKLCVLVAVDEIMHLFRWNLFYGYEKHLEYWQEVKQEIEKL